jgi:hypothetical protein
LQTVRDDPFFHMSLSFDCCTQHSRVVLFWQDYFMGNVCVCVCV